MLIDFLRKHKSSTLEWLIACLITVLIGWVLFFADFGLKLLTYSVSTGFLYVVIFVSSKRKREKKPFPLAFIIAFAIAGIMTLFFIVEVINDFMALL